MKVCILSMQQVNNMGSVLQSYALKKMIEDLGHTVSFIDIKRMENDAVLCKQSNHFQEGEKKTIGLAKIAKIDRYTINRLRIKRKAKKQRAIYAEFRTNQLGITKEDNKKSYDVCVIGSDEVFNCCDDSPWGFTSQLFGNVEQANKVITYAACCGGTRFEDITEEMGKRISDVFEGVSALSVRDQNTKEFVSHLTDAPIEMSVDPVVAGDFSEEMAAVVLPKMPKKYCVVYSYYNRMIAPEEVREIRRFCKEKNLEIVAIGSPQRWIKMYIPMTPFEALTAISQAEFVITDTFHGTIFSAKYAKRFATMVRSSNRNKLTDLVKKLEVEDHFIADISQISQAYTVDNDRQARAEQCRKHREKTMAYLQQNL